MHVNILDFMVSSPVRLVRITKPRRLSRFRPPLAFTYFAAVNSPALPYHACDMDGSAEHAIQPSR